MPVAPEWHDLQLFFGELRLHADYGLTDWLAADVLWSLRVASVKFQLEDAATRTPITPPYGTEIHHRSETLIGVTDPWLSLRATQALGHWSFQFRLGVTVPVGSTVPNPFVLGRAGKEHEHIQFGTGTFNPLTQVGITRAVKHLAVEAWLLAKAALYQNGNGYQAGDQLMGGIRASSDLWLPRWSFMIGALAYHEEAERWSGVVEDEGNLGRSDLILETAVSWRFAEPWSVNLSVRAPLRSWVVGEQLSTPAIGELSVARSFELLGGGRH